MYYIIYLVFGRSIINLAQLHMYYILPGFQAIILVTQSLILFFCIGVDCTRLYFIVRIEKPFLSGRHIIEARKREFSSHEILIWKYICVW